MLCVTLSQLTSVTAGSARRKGSCATSLPGSHASSASRNAMNAPRAASMPALRAPLTPRRSAIGSTRTPVMPNERTRSPVPSLLASSMTIVSTRTPACAATDASARSIVARALRAGMITLTSGSSTTSDGLMREWDGR
jgi:hypothetical protein